MKKASVFKDTILLPQTSFPMKAHLTQKEPELIEFWNREGVYYKMVAQNKNKSPFTLVDGPIYANGAIHIGHCLNRILKDMVVKYKNMKGFLCEFIPGWDCHGLPIEITTSKKLQRTQKNLSKAEFRNKCRKEAIYWHKIQKKEFQRIGTIGDWKNPYLTLQASYEADEIRLIKKIFKNGFLFQGKKPVHWSAFLGTALAASEIIYKEIKSPSIDVLFKVTSSPFQLPQETYFVIWTTTPWTLPSNTALAVGKDFDYGLYEDLDSKRTFILATLLKESLEKKWQKNFRKIKILKGSQLEGIRTQHPFLKRYSVVVLSEHVELSAGTGCVHIAPGHGLDDYKVGLAYNLPTPCPVNSYGKFTKDVPSYEGLLVWKANPLIIEKLKQNNLLVHHEEISHSYPHDERTKKPTIFRLTSQWFVAVESLNKKLKKKALDVAKNNIQFIPPWGQKRFESMIENNPDWCISRQRLWGVPLPVFYCKSCETPLLEEKLLDKVADETEKHQEGSNVFYEKPASYWTKGYECKKCQKKEFVSSTDTLDVWFDSASCHTSVQKKRKALRFPADLYLEGSDQHRGWFQTSLLSSLAAYNEPPFKKVLTHGFVNDAKGHKMSKSKGNVVIPQKVIQEYGAEILRLWVAHEDYSRDVTVGVDIFKRLSESYRKIRNTFRFLLGNIHDFDMSKDKVDFKNMLPLDQWALLELNKLIKNINQYYDDFQFHKSYHKLNEFFTVTLSSFYLDILKDRLYTSGKKSLKRRSAQTSLYLLTHYLARMMCPILSFTSEEVYQFLLEKKLSVFLEPFPTVCKEWSAKGLSEKIEIILKLRELVTKDLERLRTNKVIGSSLEAEVHLQVNEETYRILKEFYPYLKEIFIVSEIFLKQGEQSIKASKTTNEKCPRCWKFYKELSFYLDFEEPICKSCQEALSCN